MHEKLRVIIELSEIRLVEFLHLLIYPALSLTTANTAFLVHLVLQLMQCSHTCPSSPATLHSVSALLGFSIPLSHKPLKFNQSKINLDIRDNTLVSNPCKTETHWLWYGSN